MNQLRNGGVIRDGRTNPVRDLWENVGEMASSRSWLSCVPLMVGFFNGFNIHNFIR